MRPVTGINEIVRHLPLFHSAAMPRVKAVENDAKPAA